MRTAGSGRWDVCLPAGEGDPFLAAALWLVEREHGVLVGARAAFPATSIHARTLLEAVPLIDPAAPGPCGHESGLGIVAVEPSAHTLELLDRGRFGAGCALMLLPSALGSEAQPWQDAWCWAQLHDAPRLADQSAPLDRRSLDPAGVLTDEEVWALALRAGAGPVQAAVLRAARRGEFLAGGRVGRRRLAWRQP